MGLEARVADLEAGGFQKAGDEHRVGLLGVHADLQGLDSPHQKPAVKGREAAAGCVDGKVELVTE